MILNLLHCEIKIFENFSLNQGSFLETKPYLLNILSCQPKGKDRAISSSEAEWNLERNVPDC